MSKAAQARFETEGILDEPLLKAAALLAARPPFVRIVERTAQAIMALCLLFLFGLACASGMWGSFFQVLGVTAGYFLFMWAMRKWAASVTVKSFREQNPSGQCTFASFFDEDGVHIRNGGNGAQQVIAYTHIARLCQAEGAWVLLTKMKAIVPIYQACLTGEERKDLLALLKEKCPKLKIELTIMK